MQLKAEEAIHRVSVLKIGLSSTHCLVFVIAVSVWISAFLTELVECQ